MKKPDWLRPQIIGGTFILWILFLFFAFRSSENAVAHNAAVVMENDAPLVNAPQQTKAQSYIPEGTTVKLMSEKAGYMEVQLPDGRTGWIQTAYLNKI